MVREAAVIVETGECRRLTGPVTDLVGILLGGPKLDDDAAEVFTEVEAERSSDFGRPSPLDTDGLCAGVPPASDDPAGPAR
jgi:hypothetical protein